MRKVPMDQSTPLTRAAGMPKQTQQAIAVVVVIWVVALVALVPGMATSSGPTIAASLIVLAAAPFVLVMLLGCAAVMKRRAKPPKDVEVMPVAA